jgi:hypothetical protein
MIWLIVFFFSQLFEEYSRFPGLFQHSDLAGLLYSCPNKFPHSSPEAPRIIHMRGTSTSEGGNYPPILPAVLNLQESRWDFLHAGTYYFTASPKEGILRIFRMPEKSNGFGRVPVASMLTTRPPKPSIQWISLSSKL